MRSERSPDPICPRRSAARSASSLLRWASYSLARSMVIALDRFLCCERSSCTKTIIPLGRWVMRMADSVLLTCWPPAPCARMVSILRSSSLILMSTSSTSGSTATVDAAGGFGVGHALHAMHAGFEFELGKDAAAVDLGDDLLKAAFGAFAQGQDFRLPALLGGIALVHSEQVAGEQCGLVAAGAGADFEDGVVSVHRVFRDQRKLDLLFELVPTRL